MTFAFINTNPETSVRLPNLVKIAGAIAQLFRPNDPVTGRANDNQQQAELSDFQQPEPLLFDAPSECNQCIRYFCGAVFNVCFAGAFGFERFTNSSGDSALRMTGEVTSGVRPTPSLCVGGFSIMSISNSCSGTSDNTRWTEQDINERLDRNPTRPTFDTGISRQANPDLRGSGNSGSRPLRDSIQSVRDRVDSVREALDAVTRSPSGSGTNRPISLPDVIQEITINVNADIQRIISTMIELFSSQNEFLGREFELIRTLISSVLRQASDFRLSTEAKLDNITNLLTEALPQLDNIDEIRAQLETVFNRVDDLDSDLQLTTGIVRDVLEVVTQVLEEAGEIKNRQKTCEEQEEEEEEEGCCDLVEEMHEVIMGQYGSSFLFSPDCEDERPQTVEWTGSAFSSANAGIAELGARLDVISRKICDLETVAAVPEGWNLRPENQRSQLVVQLAVVEGKTIGSPNRQITIPHYAGGRVVPAISYRSGSFYGMLVLSDNSKVRVYASSQAEAESVVTSIRSMVSGEMLIGSLIVSGHVRKPIQSNQLVARIAKFYAPGHEPGRSPIWVARVAR